jgi:predicted amidophosphoribosyltransferase
VLCVRCRAALRLLTGPMCERCGAPTAWPVSRCRECSGRRLAFGSARAAVAYDRAVASLVSAWKDHGRRKIADLAAELVADVVPAPRANALASVPPDGDRSLKRGHHPAGRLSRELGERWGLEVAPLLVRSDTRRRQRGLPLEARRRNVRGAFRAVGEAPARVVLIDDVYTSGATAGAAASALRKAGARRVEVVTFARAVR